MTILEQMLEGTGSVAILGHIRPDGDCLGSALGLYNYLRLNYPAVRAAVYLEEASCKFGYLQGFDEIRHQADEEVYGLCVCLDCGDLGRLGGFAGILESAGKSLCLDHHVTNTRFADTNLVEDGASSTCEVLYGQLDSRKIDRTVAECLYTGIIHDTWDLPWDCITISDLIIRLSAQLYTWRKPHANSAISRDLMKYATRRMKRSTASVSAWTAATLEGWEDLPASWNQPAKACAWTTM